MFHNIDFVLIVVAVLANVAQLVIIANHGLNTIPWLAVEKLCCIYLWSTMSTHRIVFRALVPTMATVAAITAYGVMGRSSLDEIADMCAMAVACASWGALAIYLRWLITGNAESCRLALADIGIAVAVMSGGLAVIAHELSSKPGALEVAITHIRYTMGYYFAVSVLCIPFIVSSLQRRVEWFLGMLCLCVLFTPFLVVLLRLAGIDHVMIAVVGGLWVTAWLDSVILRSSRCVLYASARQCSDASPEGQEKGTEANG